MSMFRYAKKIRLLSLARRAGDRLATELTQGQKTKAHHFQARMYRLLRVVAILRGQEVSK
jgi:hypothetical protein